MLYVCPPREIDGHTLITQLGQWSHFEAFLYPSLPHIASFCRH